MRDKLNQKMCLKRLNALKEGIDFQLTRNEVEQLLGDAGILVEDWSFTGHHLARYEDQGHYVAGNCRFIPAAQNYAEKKISERSRAASRANVRLAAKSLTPELRSRAGRLGGLAAPHPTLADATLIERFQQNQRGFLRRAAKTLGVTHTHIARMKIRWAALGLL